MDMVLDPASLDPTADHLRGIRLALRPQSGDRGRGARRQLPLQFRGSRSPRDRAVGAHRHRGRLRLLTVRLRGKPDAPPLAAASSVQPVRG